MALFLLAVEVAMKVTWAAVYSRVSLQTQDTAMQEAELQAMADKRGWETRFTAIRDRQERRRIGPQ